MYIYRIVRHDYKDKIENIAHKLPEVYVAYNGDVFLDVNNEKNESYGVHIKKEEWDRIIEEIEFKLRPIKIMLKEEKR